MNNTLKEIFDMTVTTFFIACMALYLVAVLMIGYIDYKVTKIYKALKEKDGKRFKNKPQNIEYR